MTSIQTRLKTVIQRIRTAERKFSRPPGSVELLAVSKTRTAAEIEEATAAGQRRFGESYLQEALHKITQLSQRDLEWHFIGRIQSNKTRAIAEHFDWVHSLDDIRHARRLSRQRPASRQPLQVCLQINVSGEASKGGVPPQGAAEVIEVIRDLPRLQLRGLMVIPASADTLEEQRPPFRRLRELRDRLVQPGLPLETLSMGMSGDLEAAIAEGASMVRIGTAIFGPRQ